MPALVFYMLVFLGVGVFFLFFHLVLGKLVRPNRPEPDKLTIYECGEPTVGSAWIQFDLRYYVVALLFVIFDVEVAFFFPWAVVFGNANTLARSDLDKDRRLAITQELVPGEIVRQKQSMAKPKEDLIRPTITPVDGQKTIVAIDRETAHNWAVLAFLDIFVFFGVLMVGFAYLWKRGDINWVRSTTAERPLEQPLESLPVREGSAVLTGSGRNN